MNAHRFILLVEDNPMDVDLTRRALASRTMTNSLEVARNDEEALAHLKRWEAGEPTPAVVLLDIKLPRPSGLDFLRALKAHPELGSVPVVVLTTSAEDCDIQEAYRLGANSYIIKPVEFEKFVEVANQIEIYWCMVNLTPE